MGHQRMITALRLAALLILFSMTSVAQVKTVTGVKGVATISNISPEEAKVKAIDAAKVEALRLAGVEEHVQSFDFLERREANNKYNEFFHSVTSVQSMGNVVAWKLIGEQKRVDNTTLLYEVIIDADVKIYKTRADVEFQLNVAGLKPVYKSLDHMTFNITPGAEGYLSIFVLDEKSVVTQIFPNEHEKNNKLSPGQRYDFPLSPHFNYEVFTDLKEERNDVIFLFTRKNAVFTKTAFEDFIGFVYALEPADRFLAREQILIVSEPGVTKD